MAECLADEISARFPWNIIVAQGGAPPVDEILRIVRPGRHIGTIFARVTPGGWLGMKDVGEFTVADVEHIGRLWFDSSSEEWVYDGAQSARMKFSSAGKGQSLICATYDLPSSGNGRIILRAFSPQSGGTMKGALILPDAVVQGIGRQLWKWSASVADVMLGPSRDQVRGSGGSRADD